MALVSTTQMLNDARREHRGIGAFMAFNYEAAEAIAITAKKYNQPVIFLAGGPRNNFGGFRGVTEAAKTLANDLGIDIAVHADHFREFDRIAQAIQGGFSSVMIDASRLPLEENIAQTREVVRMAHACGVSVEAELGRLPGNEGDEDVTVAEAFQTDPAEALYFVEQTGVDALAVSIGTMHGVYPDSFKPEINIARLKEIAEKVSIPLVMHGGSGTPDDKVAESILHGIAKINVATDLLTAYFQRVHDVLEENPKIRKFLVFGEAKKAIAESVEEKYEVFLSNVR